MTKSINHPEFFHTGDNAAYNVGPMLGKGAFAHVYEARVSSRPDNSSRALKIFNADLDGAGAFCAEMTAIERIGEHPHIIKTIWAGEGEAVGAENGLNSHYYSLMELATGGSLHGYERRIVGDMVRMGQHVTRALGHIHGKGFVHRDVKPSNILIMSEADLYKLSDLDAAASIYTGDSKNPQTFIKGTPAFMPPEAFCGESAEYSDTYSLGVTMAAAIIGGGFDRGEPSKALVLQELAEEAKVPRDNTLNALATVVNKAMQLDIAMRYPTAASMGSALEELSILHGESLALQARRAREEEPTGGWNVSHEGLS